MLTLLDLYNQATECSILPFSTFNPDNIAHVDEVITINIYYIGQCLSEDKIPEFLSMCKKFISENIDVIDHPVWISHLIGSFAAHDVLAKYKNDIFDIMDMIFLFHQEVGPYQVNANFAAVWLLKSYTKYPIYLLRKIIMYYDMDNDEIASYLVFRQKTIRRSPTRLF